MVPTVERAERTFWVWSIATAGGSPVIESASGLSIRSRNWRAKAENDLKHTDKGLAQAGNKLSAEQRAAIDAATATLRAAMAGADATALQQAGAAFAAATNPLATLVMNEVLRRSLGGENPDDLDPDEL